jgi:hypothetical protein
VYSPVSFLLVNLIPLQRTTAVAYPASDVSSPTTMFSPLTSAPTLQPQRRLSQQDTSSLDTKAVGSDMGVPPNNLNTVPVSNNILQELLDRDRELHLALDRTNNEIADLRSVVTHGAGQPPAYGHPDEDHMSDHR